MECQQEYIQVQPIYWLDEIFNDNEIYPGSVASNTPTSKGSSSNLNKRKRRDSFELDLNFYSPFVYDQTVESDQKHLTCTSSLKKRIKLENPKDVRLSILVGVILFVAEFTGTTIFSAKNCFIKWRNVSELYDIALERNQLQPARKSEKALKNLYKDLKAKIRGLNTSLKSMLKDFDKLNEQLCLLDSQDIYMFLGVSNKTKKPIKYSYKKKNSWTRKQDIILYGAIIECMRHHGSLHLTKNVPSPWESVRTTFNRLCQEKIPSANIPSRTASSLQRHFKEIRSHLVGPGGNQLFLKQLLDAFKKM